METLFTGRNRLLLADVESTNTWALELMRDSPPAEGTLVLTFNQRAGRGQRGNEWFSEPFKNIAVSIILYPRFLSPALQFDLTRAIALAVAEAIENILSPFSHPPVSIKWPNDIYVGDRKISGILIENIIRDESLSASVCGIGINVNQISFSSSAPNAVSLANIAGQEFDLDKVVDVLCSFTEKQYLRLRSGKTAEIRNDYHQRQYGKDTEKKFSQNGEVFSAVILGTTDNGLLRLQFRNGEEKQFNFQELKLV